LSHLRILIIYDHFLPAWKAGGPIRSIENLINSAFDTYEFYILCSAYEFGEFEHLPNIPINQRVNWNDKASVYYNGNKRLSLKTYEKIYNEVRPDVILIKGLYSINYNILPLFYSLLCKNHNKIIISPIGMLHPGALSQKPFKKRFYLTLFKILGIHKKVYWHATNEQEANYIELSLGKVAIVKADNFPNVLNRLTAPVKQPDTLIMGTLSLISPMKNHLEILQSLKKIKHNIVWHIYGPVKDADYWSDCINLIKGLPNNIQVLYHGSISPDQVSSAFEKFQLFIHPSKSENFGHAIYEALSAGKPVITTDTTPFLSLKEAQAGVNVSAKNLQQDLSQAINFFAALNQDEFSTFQNGATEYAKNFSNTEKLKLQYEKLFAVDNN
jgi:glycosyltransferase involved in cell wall biosynthesis